MRVYGRVTNRDGSKTWKVVTTDANGFNDEVYLTALCQCMLLNLNESPFWASFGIPAQNAVQQQVPPDYYVTRIQQFFSSFFANLAIARLPGNPPTYKVSVTTNQGAQLNFGIAVPQ